MRNMQDSTLEQLKRIGDPVHVSQGEVIFREGDPCGSVYVLCSGRVKLSATSREGRTLILKIARSGAALGLIAALTNQIYEVTAETVGPCRLRKIRRQLLLDFLDSSTDAGIRTAIAIAQEYKTALSAVQRLALTVTASGRVAGLLLEWSREQKAGNSSHAWFPMPLTHGEIGSMTATCRETVTRVLGQFQRDQVISIRGGSLTVLQPVALEQIAVQHHHRDGQPRIPPHISSSPAISKSRASSRVSMAGESGTPANDAE